MTIEEQILANPVLREVNGLLKSERAKEVLANQTAKGLAKYGTTVNPDNYSPSEWINHAIEEGMDMLVYYTTLKMKVHYLGLKESGLMVSYLEDEIKTIVSKIERIIKFKGILEGAIKNESK